MQDGILGLVGERPHFGEKHVHPGCKLDGRATKLCMEFGRSPIKLPDLYELHNTRAFQKVFKGWCFNIKMMLIVTCCNMRQ